MYWNAESARSGWTLMKLTRLLWPTLAATFLVSTVMVWLLRSPPWFTHVLVSLWEMKPSARVVTLVSFLCLRWTLALCLVGTSCKRSAVVGWNTSCMPTLSVRGQDHVGRKVQPARQPVVHVPRMVLFLSLGLCTPCHVTTFLTFSLHLLIVENRYR